ncbi:MAG: hypothetical protein QI197_00965 [Candidatus Korarchaeota archaeon]|nr:hypothetical protein [Candidatus Korarchaeota archaeon]
MIRVGIVGHDPYTIPIADCLERQPDIKIIGAYNHDITPFSRPVSKRLDVYCSESSLELFKEMGIKVSGFLDDFIEGTDAFLEYSSREYSVRISYGSSGMVVRPYDVLLERLSLGLPLQDISVEEISDELFCCPYFRAFRLAVKLREDLSLGEVRESLLRSPRVVGISGEDIYLQDLCAFLPVSFPHSIFSVNVLLSSVKVVGREAEMISLLGYLLPLPEVVDTLRESEGVKRDFSRSMTDEYLSIKGGLII